MTNFSVDTASRESLTVDGEWLGRIYDFITNVMCAQEEAIDFYEDDSRLPERTQDAERLNAIIDKVSNAAADLLYVNPETNEYESPV